MERKIHPLETETIKCGSAGQAASHGTTPTMLSAFYVRFSWNYVQREGHFTVSCSVKVTMGQNWFGLVIFIIIIGNIIYDSDSEDEIVLAQKRMTATSKAWLVDFISTIQDGSTEAIFKNVKAF